MVERARSCVPHFSQLDAFNLAADRPELASVSLQLVGKRLHSWKRNDLMSTCLKLFYLHICVSVNVGRASEASHLAEHTRTISKPNRNEALPSLRADSVSTLIDDLHWNFNWH